MPIEAVFNGARIVYRDVPWPPECKLRVKPAAQMTVAEMKAEIQAHDDGETTLHCEYCVNPTCPAKQ
jgi:hypothetical protein